MPTGVKNAAGMAAVPGFRRVMAARRGMRGLIGKDFEPIATDARLDSGLQIRKIDPTSVRSGGGVHHGFASGNVVSDHSKSSASSHYLNMLNELRQCRGMHE